MIRNYLIVALRNLQKDKAYAVLNVVGLALGIAVTVLIFSFIRFELSFDDFHEKGENIYRVQHIYSFIGAPIGPALVDQYPEIEEVLRLYMWGQNTPVKLTDEKAF